MATTVNNMDTSLVLKTESARLQVLQPQIHA